MLLIIYAVVVYWTVIGNHMVILAVLVAGLLLGALAQILFGR